ncbi:type VII secretion protein EccC [Streptomyces sp. NRRL F-5123]|uniref:type VII secretion protein EccC n=1 Tax=Streptomyces sp. NRRL F-5123 TaxID=1463856 RepID=UPI0004E1EEBF|nr:type VII secretion protein EccC [Streptomyces sp. NRRL F-5123]
MSRIIFHRPARVLPPQLPTEPVVLAAPPQPVGRDANNWLMLLMPLMTSFSMAGYLMAGGRKLLILLGICFVVVSIGTTVAIRLQLRRSARRDKLRARDRYLAHLVEVRRAARQVAESQRVVAAWAYPSPYRLWAIATRRRRVWERRATDADFLSVCVGVGTAPLATPIRMATRNDPTVEYDPRAKSAADRVIATMSTVGSQPATMDMSRGGVVSVLGPTEVAGGVARAVVCQIAVLHAPDDVGLVVVGDADTWGWTKWLPHTHEPEATGEAGVVPLVAEEFDSVADHLRDALDRFAEQPPMRRGYMDRDAQDTRRRLVVVLDGYDPRAGWARSQTAAELLAAAGPESGITVLCVVNREQDEPSRADVRVRVDDTGRLALDVRATERGGQARPEVTDVLAEWPEVVLCEAIARELAPLRLSVEGEEVLAQVTSLPSMLGIGDLDDFDPESLWVAADDDAVLRMPLGFDGNGQPLVLDLKEAARGGMGPHGLVVGATGSGKSELLRTLVTGLAATHSPELLSFVLVDFKGGATFAGLSELPHAAGMITNLMDDLALVDRVRDALVGEQQRRQRILRDAGNIDNIRDYQLHRAAGRTAPDGSPLPPLPYLLIIVDEFGELLTSRPEFIELFVQIGRVGRSLGMHLLLATQRLEEGRLRGLDANLSYRICLRTFSAAESRVVIGTPDAYQLPSIPGSAYLKVTDAVYERFRVAHVSGPHLPAARTASGEPGVAAPVVFGLRVPPVPGDEPARYAEPAEPRPAIGGPTEMQVIVERLRANGQTAHQVWLPPLPPALPLDDLTGPATVRPGRGLTADWWPRRGELLFPVGVSDIPSQQVQQPLVADFAQSGNLMVIGAPQSGKSTLLRTLMLSAMLTHTPDEAQFACLDFGGGSLLPFEQAPHVSAVAGRHDLAQARRILAEVRQVVAERELQFRGMGIDSATEFRRRRAAGGLPQRMRTADLFLVIDNWAAARSELEDIETAVLDLANRGLGVGVHLVLTANRWGDVRTALRDAVNGRLELRLNDPGESEVDRRIARAFGAVPPGRGLAPPGIQYQVALPRMDGRPDIDALADAQADVLAKLADGWEGAAAPAVRMLPERLAVAELDLPAQEPPGVPIGIAEHDLNPVYLDLAGNDPHFVVFGDSGAGKTEFLRAWITGMMARHTSYEARFVLFDFRRGLLGLVPPEYLGAYAGDAGAAASFAQAVADKLAERLPPPDVTVRQLRDRSWWQGPELYVVVDDFDLVSSGRQSPLAPLVDYLPQARELGFHMVVARRVGGTARRQISEPVLGRLQELGTDGLVLSGDPREGAVLGDQRARLLPPGRGILVRRSAPRALVQLALTDDAPDA